MTTVVDADTGSQKSPTSQVGVLLTLFGFVAGIGDYWLVVTARGYCEAGAEPGDLGALLVFHLPTRLVLGGVLGGGTFLLVRLILLAIPAIRRSHRSAAWRTSIAAATAVLAILAMVLVDFAVVGTLDGYPSDTAACPPTNIPPWWPSWLPG